MTWDEYERQIKADVRRAFEDNATAQPERYGVDAEDRTIDVDALTDALMMDDAVTGSASGSYTFNRWKAEENIAHVIWTDEFEDMVIDDGGSLAELFDGDPSPEGIDVFIRCRLLPGVCDEFAGEWATAHGFAVV